MRVTVVGDAKHFGEVLQTARELHAQGHMVLSPTDPLVGMMPTGLPFEATEVLWVVAPDGTVSPYTAFCIGRMLAMGVPSVALQRRGVDPVQDETMQITSFP